MEALAIHGGAPVKTGPFGTGKRFGEEEAAHLLEALEQNTLFYHFGTKVKRFWPISMRCTAGNTV
ncbi:hypothetical protein [Paenibacillus sp. Y412MC10]|uniref:hypothetical protein n=1 Tax=Geobacillus sp. (strain Y412MC10) TaxID=481743 RepID=UPI0021B34617|nr:hypothetical protein [Paenibacillus sp. Y412MC10]